MKFLCDRCKTRYSIADERVRGKILKIRCKNCANVISVREGMTDADDAAAAAPAAGSALQSAFASVMVGTRPGETQPPPPVLEEEWYVAIDGNQSGPFTLAEAQAWVGAKAASDDLYCWCEGFDDWLPVEKVSHFRGLRAKREETPKPKLPVPPLASAPTAPTSRKAAAATPAPSAAPPPAAVEDEPKPLFAATLAKLEAESQSGPLPLPPSAKGAPSAKNGEAKRPDAKLDKAAPAKSDKGDKGDRLDKSDKKKSDTPAPLAPLAPVSRAPLPMPARTSTPLPSPSRGAQAAVASAASSSAAPALARDLRADTEEAKPAAIAPPKPATPAKGTPARRPLFDTGEPHEEPEALDDSALEPDDSDEAKGDADLDLDIGEVSRVVRLPDLMAAHAARTAKPKPAMGRTTGASQAIGRGSGQTPAITGAAGAASAASSAGGDELPPLSDAVLADAQPPLAPSMAHRRNHNVMWMIGGAVLLLGVIVVAAVAASAGGGEGEQVSTGNLDVSGLGYSYDPLRPRGGSDEGTGSGSVTITGPRVVRPRNTGGNSGGNSGTQQVQQNPGSGRQEIGPNGEPILPLTGDDIIQTSQKMSMGTSRCYERALKKDPFLQVQKIQVSLKVDAAGVVTDVSLDSHANDELGQCLVAAIRRWPFRRSTEGINTIFPLVFQQH